jgi:Tol biopolymer transport system component
VRPVEAKDGGGGEGEAARRGDPDIFVWDTQTKQNVTLVKAPGYDGGPFFSPDGRWICYRSDRRGDNNLQLFIGELAFDDASDPKRITGLKREIQITDDAEVVNWAPFWHPSGEYLVYASSAVAHFNYEVFAIDVSGWTKPGMPLPSTPAPRVRITHASGFDGLPAFSTDGQYMLITSQRGGRFGSEERPTSQLWLARVASKPDFSKPEPLPRQFDGKP